MKKFLKLWLRHPMSVTIMIIMAVIAIQTRNISPIIIGLIPCSFLFVLWEIWLYCR